MSLTNGISHVKFKLDDDFVKKYKRKKPPFGFNGLGEIVYLRSYSRLKPDGKKEQWWETVRRVVEGTYSIQKRHIIKYGLGWDHKKAAESAEEMYDRIFQMKFLPPGRGLWAMGSPIIEEKGLYAALNNCAFVSTDAIDKEPTKPFEFVMDMSMLGVGVGFDTKGADLLYINSPLSSKETVYVIPDTREGWVDSLRLILESYLIPNRPTVVFDYSKIRLRGELIKTFGGISAGPEPLINLHKKIREILGERDGDKINSTDITDIMNLIGVCVVSGNVRRSAEIAFGEPDDEQFRKLKDYRWDEESGKFVGSSAKRAEWGWSSNNSIFGKIGMDYSDLSDQIAVNGEPGLAFLDNMRAYSRMKDSPDYKDAKAKGGNPCLEQTLESFELCCLVETFPSRHEEMSDFFRTLKFAYLYAKTVTLGNTHWPETNRVMLRNRRIGTSVSGVAMFLEDKGIDVLKEWLDKGYETISRYDEVYSDWLCIPKSIKKTSVKPSGSVSLLAGVTPGLRYPESEFYIRRVILEKGSELANSLSDAGYKIEQSVQSENSVVVEIPVSLKGYRTADQISIWEQISLASFMQEWWADNQVSATITFNKHEAKEIKPILDYFQYKLKGISFLPKTDGKIYPQMPYEEITEEKYNELSSGIRRLKITETLEDSKPELYCDTDSCII